MVNTVATGEERRKKAAILSLILAKKGITNRPAFSLTKNAGVNAGADVCD